MDEMYPNEFIDYVTNNLGLDYDTLELVQRIVDYAWGLGQNSWYKRDFLHDILDDFNGITPELIDAIIF